MGEICSVKCSVKVKSMLPLDCLFWILLKLEPVDLYKCSTASKRLGCILMDRYFWRRKLNRDQKKLLGYQNVSGSRSDQKMDWTNDSKLQEIIASATSSRTLIINWMAVYREIWFLQTAIFLDKTKISSDRPEKLMFRFEEDSLHENGPNGFQATDYLTVDFTFHPPPAFLHSTDPFYRLHVAPVTISLPTGSTRTLVSAASQLIHRMNFDPFESVNSVRRLVPPSLNGINLSLNPHQISASSLSAENRPGGIRLRRELPPMLSTTTFNSSAASILSFNSVSSDLSRKSALSALLSPFQAEAVALGAIEDSLFTRDVNNRSNNGTELLTDKLVYGRSPSTAAEAYLLTLGSPTAPFLQPNGRAGTDGYSRQSSSSNGIPFTAVASSSSKQNSSSSLLVQSWDNYQQQRASMQASCLPSPGTSPTKLTEEQSFSPNRK